MPRRRITLRQLETFSTVARLGSFTRAAEALHLTQPAISIQIRQLADTVGMPLFDQSGRTPRLTAAGEELLATTRRLNDVWNGFETAIDAMRGLRRGKLRVALVTTAKYFLPRMLGSFCRRYPDIAIELEIANRDRIVERLRNNEDDLYVMSFPPEDLDIEVHPFLDNELVVLAPRDHWAAGRAVTLAELAGDGRDGPELQDDERRVEGEQPRPRNGQRERDGGGGVSFRRLPRRCANRRKYDRSTQSTRHNCLVRPDGDSLQHPLHLSENPGLTRNFNAVV